MAEPAGWMLPALGSIAVLAATVAIFVYRRSQYWKRRGVPSIGNIFYGDFKDNVTQKECIGDSVSKHYQKYKHLRFTGSFMLGRPILIIHDPELIKEVYVKGHQSFGGSGLYYDAKRDPLSANLLFMSGHDWKTTRTKLTPAFTSGKIKYMFGTVIDRVQQLQVHLEKERAGKEYVVTNARELSARVATDVILSVTLGIMANSVDNPDAKFRRIGRLMFDPSFSQFVKGVLFANMHSVVRLFNVHIAPKEVEDFFMNAIHDAVGYREKNGITRNDFLDLMIQLKNYGTFKIGNNDIKKSPENYMTTDQIAAQAFFFFLAGFETTSSTISYALFEIAKHPEIQRKMQAECDAALNASGGTITYDTVQSLEYMEMVVQESQRLYPAVAVLNRATTVDCVLPTTNIKLEKDTAIQVSVTGLHRDPAYFPNPDKFDPDRWLPENKTAIGSQVFIPFGEGPRICIGQRFAMVNVKAVILSLLSKYDVKLADGTPTKLEFDPRNFLPAPKFPLNMKFIPRQN